jgi:uncharacterized membrane protein
MSNPTPRETTPKVGLAISLILRYGVLLSFIVTAIGSILFLTSGQAVVRLTGTPLPHNPVDVLTGVLQLQPKAIIDFGLFLLIATPVTRVAVAAIAFLVEADFTYALISLVVLLVLVASFLLGKGE